MKKQVEVSLKLGKFIFVAGLLIFGGFYDWNVTFLGSLLCLYVLLLYHGEHDRYKKEHKCFLWIPEIIFIFQLLVSFWAVDQSANIVGIIRGIVILLWMHICFQWDQNMREQLLYMIPDMGILIVILGGIFFLNKKTRVFFWRAERLGGFFQYANTCALFLLLGIIICIFMRKIEKPNKESNNWCIIKIFILLLGILLTGSRSILIIGFLWGIFYSVFDRKFGKIYTSVGIGVGTILGVYYMLTGEGTQNISRIFTIMHSNSTLYGRILYDVDGISIMLRYPIGLGYLGYYYVQHALQTGVYTVRFVHNDILQIGLDYGMISMLLFIMFIIWQLVKGKQPNWRKEILAVIVAASLVDFHMQYIFIDFIIILCLDLGEKSTRQKRAEQLENKIVFIVLLAGFIFYFIPYFAIYNGKYQLALQFLPNNTDALHMAMMEAGDKTIAVAYADQILKQNPYIADAYNVVAYAAAMEGDIKMVLKNQREVLRLEKYDVDRYRTYDFLLEDLALKCEEIGQKQMREELERERADIREQLEEVRGQTNPIAYKLRDVPQYTW